jgi:hypothetical protein
MREIQQLTKTNEPKQQPARGFDTYSLLACLAISAFLIVWITLASGSFSMRSAVFLFLLPWILLRAGGIITAALRLPSFFALDFLLGVAAVSVAVMAWKVFVPLSLWVALTALLIAAAGVPKLLPRNQREPVSALDMLCVVVSLAAATGWSQDLILPTKPVEGGIVFKHGRFFLPRHYGSSSMETHTLFRSATMNGRIPAIIYHYASCAIPLLVP